MLLTWFYYKIYAVNFVIFMKKIILIYFIKLIYKILKNLILIKYFSNSQKIY